MSTLKSIMNANTTTATIETPQPAQTHYTVSYAAKDYDRMTAAEKRDFWARAENDRIHGNPGLRIQPATVIEVHTPQVKEYHFSNSPVHKFLEHLD